MKYAFILFTLLLAASCKKDDPGIRYYNKYDIELATKTNLENVSFIFTDRFKLIAPAIMNAPGINYVYDEMKSGDVIYVYATSPDSGYIDCKILLQDQILFASKSRFDTLTNQTRNSFAFTLP